MGRTEPVNRYSSLSMELCTCFYESPYKYGECPIVNHDGYNLYEIHPALEPE